MASTKENDTAKALQICLRMVLDDGSSIEDALARFPTLADSLRADLVTALWLNGQQSSYASRPGFVSSSRSRLMHQIKSGSTNTVARSRRNLFLRPAFRFAFTLLLVFSILVSTTGIASAGALPGDMLYPLKTTWEDTRLFVNQDAEHEIRLHLRFADNRIGEAITLVNRASFDHIPLAFENYRQHTTDAYIFLVTLIEQGQAQELVDEFTTTVSGHISTLLGLQREIPTDVGSSIGPLVNTLESQISSLTESPPDETDASLPENETSGQQPEPQPGEPGSSSGEDGEEGELKIEDQNNADSEIEDEGEGSAGGVEEGGGGSAARLTGILLVSIVSATVQGIIGHFLNSSQP